MFSRFNKGLLIAMAVIALSAIVYAFAATSTMPANLNVSTGSGAVGSFTVTGKTWTTNGPYLNSLTLTITGTDAPLFADVSTIAAPGNWTLWTCVITGSASPYTATCTYSPADSLLVTTVTTLDVSIHD